MTTLTLAFILAAPSAEVSVDGKGYFRLLHEGRVVYARSGRLSSVGGVLALRGAPLVPTIPCRDAANVEIKPDGTVSGTAVGQVYLALFPSETLSSLGDFFVASGRPMLRRPGDEDAGLISQGGVTPTKSGAPHKIEPATAMSSKAVEIAFRTEAEVSGDQMFLGDVAELSEAALRAGLDKVRLGTSPILGRTKTVSRGEIMDRLRQAKVDLPSAILRGASITTVSNPGQQVSHDQFSTEAVRAAKEALPAASLVAVRDTLPAMTVPAGTISFSTEDLDLNGRSPSAKVAVLVNGRRFNSRTLSLDIQAAKPIIEANSAVKVVFRKGDLKVEVSGKVKKAALAGETVEVIVKLDPKGAETTHYGVAVGPGLVEVKL